MVYVYIRVYVGIFSSINIRNLNYSQDKYEALMAKQRNILPPRVAIVICGNTES